MIPNDLRRVPRFLRRPRAACIACTLVALALAFATLARADDDAMKPPAAPSAPKGESPRHARFFDTYDANGDGKVTKDEYTGDPAVFDLIDADQDGVVTLAELGMPSDYKPGTVVKPRDEAPPARGGNLAERMEKFRRDLAVWDTDKDGKVTKDEYKGKLPFEILDRNKDGVITMDDLRAGGQGKGEPGMPGLPGRDDLARRLKEADKDGDGKLTKAEFPGAPERFAALDRDGDGVLTMDEVEGALREGLAGDGGRGRKMFQRFDKDGDGKVSRAEFPGGDEGFRALDRNGDGFISEDEVPAGGPGGAKEPRPGKADRPAAPGGAPTTPAPEGERAATPPAGSLGSLFKILDRDGDGRLSRAEFPGTDDEWRRLDRNGNGWIEADESK